MQKGILTKGQKIITQTQIKFYAVDILISWISIISHHVCISKDIYHTPQTYGVTCSSKMISGLLHRENEVCKLKLKYGLTEYAGIPIQANYKRFNKIISELKLKMLTSGANDVP